MATYTKQQLIDAYCAKTGCGSSAQEIDAEVIRVQTEIDIKIARLQQRVTEITNSSNTRLANITQRLDGIEPDAKESMKDIALDYLADQAADQSDIDNSDVNL